MTEYLSGISAQAAGPAGIQLDAGGAKIACHAAQGITRRIGRLGPARRTSYVVEEGGKIYCCANCAKQQRVTAARDRA
jgi:hypothetical protein